ncbi:uncharacterized protein LOC144560890 [Carex rostrata]
MIFNDDDQIVLPPDSGSRPKPIVSGRVQMAMTYNNKVPLEENMQRVMLELTGEGKTRSRLDLVTVLDLSASMFGDRLDNLRDAMLYVIKKLSPVDRLSIVRYSTKAQRLCPLRQMTRNSQTELKNVIYNLEGGGATNISDGLQMALKILNDRQVSIGRVGAIMLMSDGGENRGNAATVPIGNIPVHTFGFSDKQDPKVLKAIADNSLGGTYSDVADDNLTLAFSQCLGGLLSVVAENLQVTITQVEKESTIRKVSAGRYPQDMENDAGSVTITFGDLYIHEVRNMLVDLLLPATNKEHDAYVLEVSYRYNYDGQQFECNPMPVTVHRLSGLTTEELQAPSEMKAEEVRLHIAEVIKEVTFSANNNVLEIAQEKLACGLTTLGYGDIYQMKAELNELREHMKTKELYFKNGRRYAYSLLTSLGTQRQTARSYNADQFKLFSNPATREFLKEANKLLEDIITLPYY